MDEYRFFAFRYPLLYLDILVLAWTAAMLCLLTIWVGIGRSHWFVRIGALVLLLLALLPIQAHQPALLFAFVLPAIAAGAARLNGRGVGPLCTRFDTQARRFRFGVRDLLLAMPLLGLLFLGVTVLIERRDDLDWQRLMAAAPSIWLLAMLCYLLAFARRRRIAILLAILMAIPLAAAWELWLGIGWGTDFADIADSQGLSLDTPAAFNAEPRIETFACQLIAGSVFCLLLTALATLLCVACATRDGSDSSPRCHAARWTLGATVGFSVVTAIWLYWQMAQPSQRVDDDASTPNSYSKLLAVAKGVEALNSTPSLDQQATAKELADLYTAGLHWSSQPGCKPFDADASADDLNMDDFSSFRALARAWNAEGDSLVQKGDLATAARYHTATVNVGAIAANRGLIVHGMIGMAIEGIGVSGFGSIRRELPPDPIRQAIACLIAVDRMREPYVVVEERDRSWVRRSIAWRSRLGVAVAAWGRPGTTHPEATSYLYMFNQRDATLRLLIVDLAVRLYRHEQGQLPADLLDLVPRYLPSIPLDPFSGEAVIYQTQDRDFVVYCVGLDRTDNGGRFGTRFEAHTKSGFDWGLEFSDDASP